MNRYKINTEKGKELRVEERILKKEFVASVFQWRYEKKINKYMERIHNNIAENNAKRDPDKNLEYMIKV
ncbi:MAG: hypothetical protein ACFE78_08625 [Candidatus Hodarchaeota archaeon]